MAFVPFVETDQPTMAAFNEKFQQNYEAVIAAAGKVETGTYTGTGASSLTLKFSFVPKFVFIISNDATTYGVAQIGLINPSEFAYLSNYNTAVAYTVSWDNDNKSVTLSGGGTEYNFNTNYTTGGGNHIVHEYAYVAIG